MIVSVCVIDTRNEKCLSSTTGFTIRSEEFNLAHTGCDPAEHSGPDPEKNLSACLNFKPLDYSQGFTEVVQWEQEFGPNALKITTSSD